MAASKSTRHHHGRLREAAVRCSLDVVREQGLEALTLRAVADRAGVTHPALYRHFPDKTALLEVIAEDGFMELHSRIQRALARAGSNSEARLRALCRAFVRWALAAPEHFEVAVSRLRIRGRGVCHRASAAGVLASLDRQLNHVLAGVLAGSP